MHTKLNAQISKVLLGFMLGGMVLFLCFGASGPTARAQEAGTPEPNPYYTVNTVTLSDGTIIEEDIINGPPVPPPGFEVERQAVSLPESDIAAGTNTLTVPAFNWVFGCSSVSGAMIAGYYDRSGLSNIYTGPTNGGVMPLDNSSWPTWSDGHSTYPNLPLAASHQGVDGRATRGSIDDYWIQYSSTASDPYITNGWTQHTWGDAIGDYMKTSQSAFGNSDGGTSFYNYTSSASPLTCDIMAGNSLPDGTLGRKLFYEAKGYTVTDCYNQKTDNIIAGGFSFAQFKAEIDAGRPVMLNLEGHTIVGVGYNDPSTVYIHDTWDYSNHNMTWGGSYAGMELLSVSIVNIQGTNPNPPGAFGKTSPSNGASSQPTSPTLSWGASSDAASYEYCYDTTNDNACSSWVSTGTTASANLSGLSAGVPYYWQVRANNGNGTTYAEGVDTAYWSFTTAAATPPGAFGKTSPLNGATGQPTSPTLSWGASSDAASYEYCYDTTNDNACSSWVSTGTDTSANLSGLTAGATYYWQVRANNASGTTYAEGSMTSYWSFSVTTSILWSGTTNQGQPMSFMVNSSGTQWSTFTLAIYVSQCGLTMTVYPPGPGAITNGQFSGQLISSGTFSFTGQFTSASTASGTYSFTNWTIYGCGTLNASGTWNASIPLPPPGAFAKTSPTNGVAGQSTSPTLSWGASSGAASYEYCSLPCQW